jgi:tryptophan synthase alpha chain
MGRLGDAMAALRREGRKSFVPYVTSGDPTLARTREVWRALDDAGADVIEVGIPFSDPMADGPTIQRASFRSLQNGTTLSAVLDALAEERASISARCVIFSYYNPILAMGLEAFAKRADAAGVDGVLIPDLVPEEAEPLLAAISPRDPEHGIDPVFLVAPTTPDDRLAYIGKMSPALVYAVSLTGVTGARTGLPPDLADFLARCRKHVPAPIVVGFGVSTPEQAAAVAKLADGVVVGSALVKVVEETGDSDDLAAKVGEAAKALVAAVRSVGAKG